MKRKITLTEDEYLRIAECIQREHCRDCIRAAKVEGQSLQRLYIEKANEKMCLFDTFINSWVNGTTEPDQSAD